MERRPWRDGEGNYLVHERTFHSSNIKSFEIVCGRDVTFSMSFMVFSVTYNWELSNLLCIFFSLSFETESR